MADQSTSESVVPLPPATEGGERHDLPESYRTKYFGLVAPSYGSGWRE